MTFPGVCAKQEVEGKHCKLQVWQAFIAKQIMEKFSGVDNMLHSFIFHCISASQLNDNLWLDHFCRIKFLSAGKSLIGRRWRHMFFDLQGRAVNQVAINVKRVYTLMFGIIVLTRLIFWHFSIKIWCQIDVEMTFRRRIDVITTFILSTWLYRISE